MSDGKTDEFAILESRLSQLMRAVFIGETWVQDHYKKPTLTPLRNAYKNFSGNPSQMHFDLFQNALISCKTAENTKISDNNMPDIILAALDLMASTSPHLAEPTKENPKKNSPP